jgi:branched-chain amino acid transport system permease protein
MGNDRLKPISQLWQRPQLVRFAPYIIVGLILIIVPPFIPTAIQGILTKFLIFSVFAMGFNLIFGYTGLLSLGHAAYFGTGGYAAAAIMLHYDINSVWICTPLGILVAALLAAAFGPIALKVSGLYFLLITFALGQALYAVAWHWPWLNVGVMRGIMGLPWPALGIPGFTWNATNFYYFIFIAFAISYFLLRLITNSPFGHALVAIREGEPRMQALGYNTWLYKYLAFVISGGFAGLAGVLFVYYNRFIAPSHLAVGTSFLPMVMAIIGGRTMLFGPVIGAFIIIFVEYYASIFTPERWPLILGGIFVIAILFAREGVGVYLSRLWGKVIEHYGSAKD